MIAAFIPSARARFLSFTALSLAATAGAALAQSVPIIQPGAPGQPAKILSPQQAVRVADTRFSPDDVRYMQGMIHHHYQAVEMAALAKDRTSRKEILDAAGRITASQAGEIKFMQNWLRERGQEAPDPAAHHAANAHAAHMQGGHAQGGDDHAGMPGMATHEQMAALAAARGAEFDRLFLERMVVHHEGAITMTEELLDRSGSAADPLLERFADEVKTEQRAEINKMSAILAQLTQDPRATLKAGFRDAGQAASNVALVASLPKPTGFFDPRNPAGLPPVKPPKADAKAAAAATTDPDFGKRSPLLSFANTDMAFSRDLLAVGNYHGFNLYRLGASVQPVLLSSVVCPGGQGDVSIVGDLLIMSVEQNRGRVDCGLQSVSEDVSRERFRGIRIFNIRDPRRPVQVGQVQTCRGSHTHSVVSATRDSVIVYVSGTASVREEKELPGCIGNVPGDPRTALFRIDVVEIPLANPARSRIIDSPAVFADPQTGRLAGLWLGGKHGDDTQDTSRTDQCHDITVFPARNLAAGACSGNGIIFDISNPRKPRRIDAVADKSFSYWHSATFNNDGTKVLFTDEWGGGGQPRCRAQDRREWGANAFYDIVDGKLQYRSHYKLPAVQTEQENCVAHNGSVVPVPGRDIFVQAWYQGGMSLIDFTDSSRPTEIGYFDRGPIHAKHEVLGGYWSTYWYNGRIYATEITRGLDVLELRPSAHLSANEIAAARLANQGAMFNPQQQFPVSWPAHPVVALAYVDQLERSRALSPAAVADLRAALAAAGSARRDPALAARVNALAANLAVTGDATSAKRATALRQTLSGIAAGLR